MRITDPRQRRDLAAVMAPLSEMRTIRRHNDLVRHQFLVALHETVGRPMFRPAQLNPLGIGANWAFRGVHAFFRVVDPDGRLVDSVDPQWVRQINQHAEAELLAGPADEDMAFLAELDYVDPRVHETAAGNRLAWEQWLEQRLTGSRPSVAELRVWLLARELSHEYLDLLNLLFTDYRLSLRDISPTADGVKSRERVVSFVERVPTLRIAAEMKLEIFRDANRKWNWNILRDIDALSIAIPYCDVVVADKDAAALARRTKAPARHGSIVVSLLDELLDLIPELRKSASSKPEDANGWSQLAPGEGYSPAGPRPLTLGDVEAGCSLRMIDADGTPTTRPLSRSNT